MSEIPIFTLAIAANCLSLSSAGLFKGYLADINELIEAILLLLIII